MINQKPTVLHAIDTTGPGGAETVFLNLTERLNVEGFDNFAVIKGPGWVEEQLKARGIPYRIVTPGGFLSLPYYRTLLTLMREKQVRLVQAHLLGSILTFSLLSLITRIPVVATIHGQVDINPNEKHVWLKNRIMRRGVKKLVAVSRQLADFIAGRGLFRREQIEVIHNGIPTESYGNKTKNHDLREQLGLPPEARLVGSVGNVRPAKAYHRLIQAAAELREHYPDLHYVIAGHQKPRLMAELEEEMRNQRVSDRVHFIGFHPDTSEFLAQIDIFALSSTSEGFSIATIEAMASRVPVVATRSGGPEEIVTHGQTGWLITPDSPRALVRGISALLDDTELCEELVQKAEQHVHNTFSEKNMLEAYRALYTPLLDNSRETQSTLEPADTVDPRRDNRG